jgi:hypothetical protein
VTFSFRIFKIYEVPDEDYDYTYLCRGTVLLFGVFLFFIVEKILRFRFKVDEVCHTIHNIYIIRALDPRQ